MPGFSRRFAWFSGVIWSLSLSWITSGLGQVTFHVRKDPSLLTLLAHEKEATGPETTRTIQSLNGIWTVEGKALSSPRQILVPCCYWGTDQLRFSRRFTIPDDVEEGFLHRLHLLGVNHLCTVFLDGIKLGKHEGGYVSFSLDLPPMAPGSEHTLVLEVDRRLDDKTTLPHRGLQGIWKNFGGPFRDIYLERLPSCHLGSMRIQTKLLPNGLSCVWILEGEVQGLPLPKRALPRNQNRGMDEGMNQDWHVSVELRETCPTEESPPLVKTETPLEGKGEYRVSLVLNQPRLWSPESPFRYLVSIHLQEGEETLDHVTMMVGVRSFELKEGKIHWNCQPITLTGTSRLEYHPVEGAALSRQSMEWEIQRIKGMGANAVRLAHFPHHPYFLELCDRWGLIVLGEIPVWNIPKRHLSNKELIQNAGYMLSQMVLRDRNRTSVLAWGLGSEMDVDNKEGATFLYEVQGFIRGMDSRPTFFFSEGYPSLETLSLVDILGLYQTEPRPTGSHPLLFLSDGDRPRPPGFPYAGHFVWGQDHWVTEYPGLASPPHAESTSHTTILLLLTRLFTVSAFAILFVAPLLHWYRFEEREGRALGTVLALSSLATSLVLLKVMLTSRPSILQYLDKILHRTLSSPSCHRWVGLFFWEQDLLWSFLMGLGLLFWGGAALLPGLLGRFRKTPGDRVGLPPAALGLLVQPLFLCITGTAHLPWHRMSWHIYALGISLLLTFLLYVRNATVRWRVDRTGLIWLLVGLSLLLLLPIWLAIRAIPGVLNLPG